MTANYKLVYHGNKANLPSERDAGSFYLTDDTLELYFGDKKYGKAVRLYTNAEGKPTTPAEDVLYINSDTGVGEAYVGGNWVTVIKGYATAIAANADDTTVPTSKAVKDYVDPLTAISPKSDNVLTRKTENGEEGLYVPAPSAADTYEIAKADDSGDYAAVYNLMRKAGGTGDAVQAGVSINIPKDMVVKSGSVVTDPEGQTAGTYIKLVLQNVDDPLYINVSDLIEYVTSGSADTDAIVITVSDDHKVTATVTEKGITLAMLAEDVQTALGKAHSHSNKDLLDRLRLTWLMLFPRSTFTATRPSWTSSKTATRPIWTLWSRL
jgi:hypothetical protein